MDRTQNILEKLQKMLYLDKIGIDALPVEMLKKNIHSKLRMILEDNGDIAEREFEEIFNIFFNSQNKEGIMHLLAFLTIFFKKIDSLQEQDKYFKESLKIADMKLLQINVKKFYATRYGIPKMYEDTYYSKKEHAFKGKGCIYCVITNSYDRLAKPQFINPELDYICFTDDKELTSDVWTIIQIDEFFDVKGLDKVRTARYVKIMGYQLLKAYDYSIYIDGKIRILGNMLDYINKYAKSSSLLCCPHYVFQTLYEEVPQIISKGLDDITVVESQIERYRKEGFPETYQQIDSACLVRSHSDKELDEVMRLWWLEVKNGSKRDQLSFTYVCWKKEYIYDISDVCCTNNNYFCCVVHTHK